MKVKIVTEMVLLILYLVL